MGGICPVLRYVKSLSWLYKTNRLIDMPGLLEIYQEKWFRKTIAANKKWADMVSKPETFQAYVSGISAVTGLSDSEVAASLPARNYKEFQAKATQFLSKREAKIRAAHSMGKWARKYIEAFRAH